MQLYDKSGKILFSYSSNDIRLVLTEAISVNTDLTGLYLSQEDLSDFRFYNAYIPKARFDLCELESADFGTSNLENTLFYRCALEYANFSNAYINNLKLYNCSKKFARYNLEFDINEEITFTPLGDI